MVKLTRIFKFQSQASLVAVTYGIFAFLWILFSDWLLAALVSDLRTLSLIQTFKGWFFVAVTTALIYSLVHRQVAKIFDAERGLQESEERYREVVEGTDDLITQVDKDARFTFVNHRAFKFLGLSPCECVGLCAFDFVHAEDKDRTAAWFERCAAKGVTSASIENRQVARGGGGRVMLWTVNFRYDPEGALAGASSIARDITDRKTTEDLLAYQKALLEAQQEASPNGILVVGEDCGIRSWNQTFLRMWNLPEAVLKSGDRSSLIEICAGQLVEPTVFADKLKSLSDSPEEGAYSDELLLKDGRVFKRHSKELIGPGGVYQGRVWFFADLTDAKLAEKTLQESLRIKSEFISTAAHELRTPLAAVMGYSELLFDSSESGGFGPEQRREFAVTIHEKAVSLATIVDDLLDVSRIETGQGILLEMRMCDLGRVVDKVTADFRTRFPDRNFPLDLSEACYDPIRADPERMAQVLGNLLDNAVKYSPGGADVSVSGRVEEGAVRLAVCDRGMGMSQEQTSKIFDKFYRADASNTAIAGLGLGLSIVKYIVTEHGGSIEVESEVGEGTKITVIIPCGGPEGE